MSLKKISVILPARNEVVGLARLLPKIKTILPTAEILVVDDASTDRTATICLDQGVRVVTHPYRMGNGAAVKSGARAASGEFLVFMDADGQHDPTDLPRLLEKLDHNFDMVVGARTHSSQASVGRSLANRFYNWLASWMVDQRVEDLTSGFRAVRAWKFRQFLHLLPNGFSYPTTITMAFFRSGFPVAYLPIEASSRTGKSHIQPIKDGFRFLLIIFRIGILYSPLKIFLPVAVAHALIGLLYYAYTYFFQHRLSMATVFMLTTAVMVFLIGMVSEQITQLSYRPTNQDKDNPHD